MNSNNNHAVIMAGGTGGHIYPALAVARELIARGCSVTWLGTERGLESSLVPKAGIEIDYIKIEGVRGKGLKSLLKAPLLILQAVLQAKKILAKRHANIVLGFGGFAAGPGGVAAKLSGIPLIIHEQNAVAGTTNKLLSRIANKVFTAFPGVFAKASVVGNPVRAEICQVDDPKHRWGAYPPEEFHLLILGGSLGATALNEQTAQALAILTEQDPSFCKKIRVLHQCGGKNFDETVKAYEKVNLSLGESIQVQPYIDDMPQAYAWAHFIICRSGALTVSELAAAGCAALMVPFPHAIDDHQTQNAKWLVDAGAGKLCQQKDLNPERFAQEIKSAFSDFKQLLEMANRARQLAQVDVAETLAVASLEEAR